MYIFNNNNRKRIPSTSLTQPTEIRTKFNEPMKIIFRSEIGFCSWMRQNWQSLQMSSNECWSGSICNLEFLIRKKIKMHTMCVKRQTSYSRKCIYFWNCICWDKIWKSFYFIRSSLNKFLTMKISYGQFFVFSQFSRFQVIDDRQSHNYTINIICYALQCWTILL